MPRRIPQALHRHFFELRRLTDVLNYDTETALRELHRCITEFNASGSSGVEAEFWCKVTIRNLLGEVDGIAYNMRQAVVRNAAEGGLELTKRQRAELSEVRYDAATDQILHDRPALLNTRESLKLAFRYFPRLFGATHAVDTSSHGWLAFLRVVRVRNQFTHPRHLEHLSAINGFPAVHPAIMWFLGQMRALFENLAVVTGATVPRASDIEVPSYDEQATPWRTFFSADDHRLVQELGERTLQYVERMLFGLMDETTRAMALCQETFDSLEAFRNRRSQFAWRTFLRTLLSDVEGRISAAQFQLEAAVARGTATLSGTDAQSLTNGEVEDRLASALTFWAREFGNDYVAPRAGKHWEALKRARHIRNRITHPKKVQDLEISFNETNAIIGAYGYLGGTMQALHLDETKWLAKAHSVRDAIEEAHRFETEEDEPVEPE